MEDQVMNAVKVLNLAYNPHNIFLKYKGFAQHIDDDLTNNESNNFSDYMVENCLNLFFVNFDGMNAGSGSIANIRSVYSYWALDIENYFNFIFPHELGHNFNLYHVHQPFTGGHACEHVTRDVNDPYFNANIAGDQIVDTPAQSQNITNIYFNENCEFVNPGNVAELKDCMETPYVDINAGNYLSNDFDSECGYHFTPGQVNRMRTFLANVTAPHYLGAFNTIESLYEPFESKIIPVGEVYTKIVWEGTSGTIHLCQRAGLQHRFQKGFDYVFHDEELVQYPLTYTVNDLPVIQNELFSVQINQLDPQITKDNLLACGRAEFCDPPVSGRVVSTKFLGSTNFTTINLTQPQACDPKFEDSLPKGYYHAVTRTTLNGTSHTKILYIP